MEISFTFFEALFLGILYWLGWNEFDVFPIHTRYFRDPVGLGLVIGLFYGNVPLGLQIGATIGLVYIGATTIGAQLPADQTLAACTSIPLALKFGLDVETALMFAVPFALAGSMLDPLRRLIQGYWNRRSIKHIDAKQFDKLTFDSCIGPALVNLGIRVVPLTLVLYIFGGAAGDFVSNLPTWLANGFTVIGGILPALGLMLCVTFIGKVTLLPYFVFGFYGSVVLGLPALGVALVAVCMAMLHVQFTASQYIVEDEDEEEQESETPVAQTRERYLGTNGKLFRWFYRYSMWYRSAQSIEYFYATGILFAMLKPLRKIYQGNDDALQTALKRYTMPFITNAWYGACLTTASLALEEEIAATGDPTGEKGEAIVQLRTGLMGPFAGIGDTLQGGLTVTITKSLLYPLALAGSWVGAMDGVYIGIEMLIIGLISAKLGYNAGIGGLSKLLNSPALQKVMVGASVLGMAMMGFLTATTVKLKLALTYMSSATGTEVAIQSVLDSILPGLLPLLLSGMIYLGYRKGIKFTTMLLILIVFGLVGSLIGLV